MKELEGSNTNFSEVLSNHMIPKDIINGLYEGFYIDFLEERAKMIYNEINTRINCKREKIEKIFVKPEEKPADFSGSISIYGTYKGQSITASFNIELQEVLYKGIKSSPSAAANQAKIDMSGKETVSTNGWKWWKYVASDGNEAYLDDYRM